MSWLAPFIERRGFQLTVYKDKRWSCIDMQMRERSLPFSSEYAAMYSVNIIYKCNIQMLAFNDEGLIVHENQITHRITYAENIMWLRIHANIKEQLAGKKKSRDDVYYHTQIKSLSGSLRCEQLHPVLHYRANQI